MDWIKGWGMIWPHSGHSHLPQHPERRAGVAPSTKAICLESTPRTPCGPRAAALEVQDNPHLGARRPFLSTTLALLLLWGSA
jgi:hypothetical protein